MVSTLFFGFFLIAFLAAALWGIAHIEVPRTLLKKREKGRDRDTSLGGKDVSKNGRRAPGTPAPDKDGNLRK